MREATRTPRRAIAVGALPYLWVAAFLLAPLALVAKLSLSQSVVAQPPYLPVFTLDNGWTGIRDGIAMLGFDAYRGLFSDALYVDSLLSSLRLAGIATAATLLLAFPLAHSIAHAPTRWRPTLLALAVAPFWTSFLVRVYALAALIRNEGPLEHALAALGLIRPPLDIYPGETAVVLGIVYSYLPFMVLPLYTALERHDPALLDAARDCGAGRAMAFFTVTVPLALPGIVAGALLVFIPAVGEFVIPDLLGGSDTLMIGRTLWNDFFANRDWPAASAAATLLLLLLLGPIWLLERRAVRGLGRP